MSVQVFHLERTVFQNLLTVPEKRRQIHHRKLVNLYYDVTCPTTEESQAEGCQVLFGLGYYSLSATVSTRVIEEAFMLTQNLGKRWHNNHMVSITGISERSTTIGDLLKQSDTYHLVTLLGFSPIKIY